MGEETEEALLAQLASVLDDDAIHDAIAAFMAFCSSIEKDKEAEANLRTARASESECRAAAFTQLFLTQGGTARAQMCSKEFAKKEPVIAARLAGAQAAFADLKDKLARLRVAEASAAVLAMADAVRSEYERLKLLEVALDYDDLIDKAQNLLSRADAASWVLYKIDGGIDHILVDEAQDTNPAQWTIIENLAAEFFAGAGRSDTLRTLFAVGDEKQSIYSFQGANPMRFGEVGRAFQKRAKALSLAWHAVPLTLSFRSTAPILEAVDRVFAKAPATDGLIFTESGVITHEAFRKGEAGLVELWTVETEEEAESADAFEPWNEELAGARSVDALARRIAATIKSWIEHGEDLPAQGRNVRAGDILILVRRREPFTTPMIRELKRLNVPVAGADRMKLTDQIAVQDLIALADVLLMPEDDLALAVVLKSPLFGFDDNDLFALAYQRHGSLWSALKDKAKDDARFAEAVNTLSHWFARADFLPPYEFFAELLGADGQRLRKRMLARLGPEAAEAIDEFLDRALAYDRDSPPSLQGFVNALRAGDVEIKRDMEQQRDEVRIMTVHGAKGLQAPIVFLPDTCTRARTQGPRLYPFPRDGASDGEVGHLVWPPTGHSKLAALEDKKRILDGAEREEYHRLLYVAMTRARDRLYVCGWEGRQKREKCSWYDLIKDGLGPLPEHDSPVGKKVGRMHSAQTEPVERVEEKREAAAAAQLPEWALCAGAARKNAPEACAFAACPFRRTENGTLPRSGPAFPACSRREEPFCQGTSRSCPPRASARDRARRPGACGAGLCRRRAAPIFRLSFERRSSPRHLPSRKTLPSRRFSSREALPRSPVVARIGGYDLEGQIDRLALVEDSLLIVDYKTNRPPPRTLEEVAPAYIAQLAGYRKALARMFPGRGLRAALLWTDGPRLMEIPSPSLDAAEERLFGSPIEP